MTANTLTDTDEESYENPNLDYHALGTKLNLYDTSDLIQLDADKAVARQHFLQHINKDTVYFHGLEKRMEYLVEEGYYKKEVLDQYPLNFVKSLYEVTYAERLRFPTFLSAFKYYTSYTLKTFGGTCYLERHGDRMCMMALALARSDQDLAVDLMEEVILKRFQPATPTFLNTGRAARSELISCFLLCIEDNMESIVRGINSTLQLSKRGGGITLNLSNLHELGAPTKRIQNQSSGVNPVMKLLEDSFSYVNQLGARQGTGAIYLYTHHPDTLRFLDTRRGNADRKVRIKTLSLDVVVPGITFELTKNNGDMYLFSPYDVEHVCGVPFTEISVSEKYREVVDDKCTRKSKINARAFFRILSEIQFESGYLYIIFKDTVNTANPIRGKVTMPNLCSEILQASEASEYNPDLSYAHADKDISCNLGSMDTAKAMDSPDLGKTVETAVRALAAVSGMTDVRSVPSIERGNAMSHSISLGQMNLHGYLGRERVFYGSKEGLDFIDMYFYTVLFHAIRASMEIAREHEEHFTGFGDSAYTVGEFLDKYVRDAWEPMAPRVCELFADVHIPANEDWTTLHEDVRRYGMYNQNLQAVPPTRSISYINHSASSIHPIVSRIEIHKEGKIGRVYYPTPYITNDNLEYYQDAYEIGPEKIIDTYTAAIQHVGQRLSLTLFYPDTVTTHDVNRSYVYAWRKGIKAFYYMRIRQQALEGTEVAGRVSCML